IVVRFRLRFLTFAFCVLELLLVHARAVRGARRWRLEIAQDAVTAEAIGNVAELLRVWCELLHRAPVGPEQGEKVRGSFEAETGMELTFARHRPFTRRKHDEILTRSQRGRRK